MMLKLRKSEVFWIAEVFLIAKVEMWNAEVLFSFHI